MEVQRWGDGPCWSCQRKERKERVVEIQQQKEGKWEQGMGGEMTPASAQDLRVNLERAAAAHCFTGCKIGELGVKPTSVPGFGTIC
jgi:hypothetical protein